MQVLKEITLDKVINLYEGQVVHDKKQLIEWDDHRHTPLYELKERTLAQDKIILGALKCARANDKRRHSLPIKVRSVFWFERTPFPT